MRNEEHFTGHARARLATAMWWLGRAVRALAGIEPIAAPMRN